MALGRGEFWDLLGIMEAEGFHLDEGLVVNRAANGKALISRYGTGKWISKVTLKPRGSGKSARVEGLLDSLRGDGSFNAYDPRKAYPINDPHGAWIDGYTVLVRSVGSDNASLSLKGLPAGYKLAIGDMLTVTWGDTYRALFRILADVTAGSGGNTTEFAVTPFVPAGLQINDDVTLSKPYAEFIITPGSRTPPTNTGNRSGGISFQIEEV